MVSKATTYHITRFDKDSDPYIIITGLTLEEAQAHCRRDDTHGDGWFDGYEEDDGTEEGCGKWGCRD